MSTYLQQALPRVVIHRTPVIKKKWKLQVRFSATKENRVHQTKIWTDLQRRLLARVAHVMIRTKNSRC